MRPGMSPTVSGGTVDIGSIIDALGTEDRFWLSGALVADNSAAPKQEATSEPPAGDSACTAVPPPPMPVQASAALAQNWPDLFAMGMEDKTPFVWEPCYSRVRCAFAPEELPDTSILPSLDVRVHCDKPMLYSETKKQWMWHKKWTLPRISVQLYSQGALLTSAAGLAVHIAAAVFNSEDQCFDDVGLTGTTTNTAVGGICAFQSLFFKSTSYNHKSQCFHLIVGVTGRCGGERTRLLGCWASSPIHVDARKRQLSESTAALDVAEPRLPSGLLATRPASSPAAALAVKGGLPHSAPPLVSALPVYPGMAPSADAHLLRGILGLVADTVVLLSPDGHSICACFTEMVHGLPAAEMTGKSYLEIVRALASAGTRRVTHAPFPSSAPNWPGERQRTGAGAECPRPAMQGRRWRERAVADAHRQKHASRHARLERLRRRDHPPRGGPLQQHGRDARAQRPLGAELELQQSLPVSIFGAERCALSWWFGGRGREGRGGASSGCSS